MSKNSNNPQHESDDHRQSKGSASTNSAQLAFAGIEMAPPETDEEKRERLLALQEASRTGDYSKVPPAREPAVSVWKDENGKHYIIVPDDNGTPTALPFRIGRKLNLQKDDPTRGGFISVEEMIRNQPKPQNRPDLGRVMANHIHNNWMPNAGSTGGSGGGAGADPTAQAQQDKPKDPSLGQQLMGMAQQGAMGLAQQGAGQLLGAAMGNSASLAQLGSSLMSSHALAGMGIGSLMSMGASSLFSKAWGIDDSSSMGEQLAHKLAQDAVGALQGELQEALMGQFFESAPSPNAPKDMMETYFGVKAPDGMPMARTNDLLDGAHPGAQITTGSATVLVEGQRASRMSDALSCPKVEPGPVPHVGGFIAQGNPTVIVDSMLAARQDHMTVCTGCGMPGMVKPIQSKVHIGSVSTAPPEVKKKLPDIEGAESALNAAKQSKPSQTSGDQKKTEVEPVPNTPQENASEPPPDPLDPDSGKDDGEAIPVEFPDEKDVASELAGRDADKLQGDSKHRAKELTSRYERAAAEARTEADIKGNKLEEFRLRAVEAAQLGENSPEFQAANRNYIELKSEILRAQDENRLYSELASRARAADLLERGGNTLGAADSLNQLLEAERTRADRIAKFGHHEAFAQDMATAFKAGTDGLLNAFPALNRLGISGAIILPTIVGEAAGQAARSAAPALDSAARWLYSQSGWPRDRVPRSMTTRRSKP